MSEQEIEKEIQEESPDAPRLTPEHIDSVIADEQYYVFPGTQVTVCLIMLKNGFGVIGESACISPENFDAEKGRNEAYKDAKRKVWMLEGYLLKDVLHETALAEEVFS